MFFSSVCDDSLFSCSILFPSIHEFFRIRVSLYADCQKIVFLRERRVLRLSRQQINGATDACENNCTTSLEFS